MLMLWIVNVVLLVLVRTKLTLWLGMPTVPSNWADDGFKV